MKTIFLLLIQRVVSYLSSASSKDLATAVEFVKKSSEELKNSTGAEKRAWVITKLKESLTHLDESSIRYLIETAVKMIRK